MKRTGTKVVASLAALAFALGLATAAHAQTPNPNGVHYSFYLFGDCNPTAATPPSPGAYSGGSYPSSFFIDDPVLFCGGFANLHIWQFSEDGGATTADFHNNSNFDFSADMTMTGGGVNGGEAGINIAPWWWAADGRINCRVPDGEVAVFGGRLPFYSFTAASGVHFALNTPIHLAMTYISGPTGPSASAPGKVKYDIVWLGTPYTSGYLALDEGNTSEDPPHGLWGILNPAHVGGFLQARTDPGNFNADLRATWNNVTYDNLQVVPTTTRSWGSVKALYR